MLAFNYGSSRGFESIFVDEAVFIKKKNVDETIGLFIMVCLGGF